MQRAEEARTFSTLSNLAEALMGRGDSPGVRYLHPYFYIAAKDYNEALARGETHLSRFDFSVAAHCFRCCKPLTTIEVRRVHRSVFSSLLPTPKIDFSFDRVLSLGSVVSTVVRYNIQTFVGFPLNFDVSQEHARLPSIAAKKCESLIIATVAEASISVSYATKSAVVSTKRLEIPRLAA